MNTPKYIVIHGTDYSYRTLADQFVACEGWHKDRDFPISSKGLHIGYQRLVTGGINYECRAETDEGSHTNQGFDGQKIYQPENKLSWPKNVLSMNFQSLGICVGFDGDIEMMPNKEYELLQKQVWAWQDKYSISNEHVYFHRFFAPKTCPGSLITNQWLKDILTRPLPIPSAPKENSCLVENQELKRQLSWYNSLVESLKKLIN